jgi:hypothetical protein
MNFDPTEGAVEEYVNVLRERGLLIFGVIFSSANANGSYSASFYLMRGVITSCVFIYNLTGS